MRTCSIQYFKNVIDVVSPSVLSKESGTPNSLHVASVVASYIGLAGTPLFLRSLQIGNHLSSG